MELLIHTYENPTHGDGGYLPGDVIIAKPNGWRWSADERRVFFVVRIPDFVFSLDEWRSMSEPQTELRDAGTPDEERVQLRRCRWYLDLTKVDATRRAELVRRDKDVGIIEGEFSATDFIDKEKAWPRALASVARDG